MAVDLSARQLDDLRAPALVGSLLDRYGTSPVRLCVEVTEPVLMARSPSTDHTLEAFRALGPRVALEDFGTGYSSLAYVHALPVTTIKIDRSFIERLGPQDGSAPMVKAIVEMSHAMGLRVVAEGVNDDRLGARVADLCCENAQGYYSSKPLAPGELACWWRTTHSVPDLGATTSRTDGLPVR